MKQPTTKGSDHKKMMALFFEVRKYNSNDALFIIMRIDRLSNPS